MSETFDFDWALLLFLKVLAVIAAMVVVSILSSILSGWRRLAENFRTEQLLDGALYTAVSARFRAFFLPIPLGLEMTLAGTGVRLSTKLLFGIFHQPLFIPWSDIESVTEEKGWFSRRFSRLRFRHSSIEIEVNGRAGAALAQAYIKVGSQATHQNPEKDFACLQDKPGEIEIRYSRLFALFTVFVGPLVFIAMAILLGGLAWFVWEYKETQLHMIQLIGGRVLFPVMTGFCLIGLWVCVRHYPSSLFTTFRISEHGVVIENRRYGHLMLAWPDIETVVYSKIFKMAFLSSQRLDKPIAISVTMTPGGLEEFQEAMALIRKNMGDRWIEKIL